MIALRLIVVAVFGVGWSLAFVQVGSAANAPTAAPADEKPRTVRDVITTRPSPKLEGMAERSAPERIGDDVSEAFWDILKIRDNPDPAAIRELTEVVESNAKADSNRINRFAAGQALYCIGTPDAMKVVETDVARREFSIDLALMYVDHWDMREPARSRFMERMLLRDAGDGGLSVDVSPAWRERDGRRVLEVTVKLTNRGEKPISLLLNKAFPVARLQIRDQDGTFAITKAFGLREHEPQSWIRLAPGASEERVASLELKRDAASTRPFQTGRVQAVLSDGGAGLGLPAFGKYRVSALVAQPPLTEQAIKSRTRQTGQDVDPNELWAGRVVSKPVEVQIDDVR
jgi:hypothetical protein